MSEPLSPDYFAGMQAKDALKGDNYDALRTIWPGAYEALNRLMVDIENGIEAQDTAKWDLYLFDLILALPWDD